MTDILDKYSIQQIKDIINGEDKWPDDVYEWMTSQMAYEVFDQWVSDNLPEDYVRLANSILEFVEQHND